MLAAASLTETFTELAERFEEDHPGVTVKLAFDSSATLAQQAVDGAPADVLATADAATMDTAGDVLADEPRIFATNTMVLVTPPDNPAGIARFADLDSGDVTFVACVETAPCGKVAAALLEDNAVAAEPASLEVDVKSVLAKVTSDEADAGFVYATDAVAAGDTVRSLDVPARRRRGDVVPDRPARPGTRCRHGPPVRRPGALRHRPAGAGRRRFRGAVTARTLGRPPLVLVVPGALAATLLVAPLVTLVLDTPWGSFLDQLGTEAVRQALALTGLASAITVSWLPAARDSPRLAAGPRGLPGPGAAARRGGGAAGAAAGRRRRRPRDRAGAQRGGRLRAPRHDRASPCRTRPPPSFSRTRSSRCRSTCSASRGRLRASGERYDVVAATLGAGRWTTFRRITLPLAMPGVLAGAVLAWARSLGEFGATITFAGNYPGTTQTMPSLIYQALQSDPEVARTLSMILLVVSIGILAALRNRWLTTP